VGYNSVADIRVCLHSFSCYCLRNTRNLAKFQENLTLQQFKVIDLGVNGKPICDFLLVINIVTLAVSATFFRDRKLRILPTPPLFDAPARLNPLEFLDKAYLSKTRGMGLPKFHNLKFLTSTVFLWYTRLTDRRTGDSIYAL